jgi:asparagine synthase (glutamine-hydrolysing)
MCGIAGYVGRARDNSTSHAELAAMCASIRHRGPDEEGHYVAPGVALGMRRLSVIDVNGGSQPIASEDKSIHVVFNGEIYNHRTLRTELAPRHILQSRADTEVLVHLYEEHGERLVHHLRGMFAFAIWDARRERLLIARDRVGIKPLYYWQAAEGLAFASEVRCFLTLPDFPRQIDRSALNAYLALGYVPDPDSIFDGVSKLPPGHFLTWDARGGASLQQYWSPIQPEVTLHDDREAVEELRRLMKSAVGSHLESDVPLGAFLSGGIDSSTVVAEMAGMSERAIRTFSIGFDESEFNEAPYAAEVARALRTEHTELIVRPDADRLIEEVVHSFDEPFGDSSALPTMLVSKLARQHVTVVLSGDGGDELFAGYTRYAELLRRIEVRPAALRTALRHLALRLPHVSPGRNRVLDWSRTLRGRYAATVAQALPAKEGGVLTEVNDGRVASLDALFDPWFASAVDRDFLTQMTLVDIATYLPGDILTKVDRASMSVSLEARVPLLDHHLVEFALALPSRLKYRNGVGKWLLREAIRDLVPRAVLSRPKQGFAVPLRRWFRGELRHRLESLMHSGSPAHEFVDTASVRRLAKEHISGRRDHSSMLWRLLVLDLWLTNLRRGDLAKSFVPSSLNVEGSVLARAV